MCSHVGSTINDDEPGVYTVQFVRVFCNSQLQYLLQVSKRRLNAKVKTGTNNLCNPVETLTCWTYVQHT